MRAVLYLGTRGCPPMLTSTLDGYHGQLGILVPCDPRLLGPNLDSDELEAGLEDVATLLLDRALQTACEAARREGKALADVFGQPPPDPSERIDARVLTGDLAGALDAFVASRTVDTCYIARDALDILDEAGIRPDPVLERAGVELETR